eukprot:7034-Eustigmatos_ZCMA.PRE.1
MRLQLGYHIMWKRHPVSDEDLQGNLTVLEADLTREPAVHHPLTSQGHDIGLYRFIVQDLQPSTGYTVHRRRPPAYCVVGRMLTYARPA